VIVLLHGGVLAASGLLLAKRHTQWTWRGARRSGAAA